MILKQKTQVMFHNLKWMIQYLNKYDSIYKIK